MATVSNFVRVGGKGNPGRKPYFVEAEIDLAEAATAKGSALASSDILQAITVPADHVVMWAGLECTETPAGGTGTVLDLGWLTLVFPLPLAPRTPSTFSFRLQRLCPLRAKSVRLLS
jgi:hypothetical protein